MYDIIDQKVSSVIFDSEDDVVGKMNELQRKEKKEKHQTIPIASKLNYLPNSTVPDDEEYEEFYEDETCYSDEELDELEERYFW
jgi:hypothetical protein